MNITIKESEAFRLILKKNPCLAPQGLNSIEMVGEQLTDGKVSNSSTYQFFMTQEQMNTLAKALTE
jgi:hypothetical protein